MRNKKRLTKGVNQQLQEFINLQGAVLTDKVKIDSYRLGFHIMPPYGFLNDPNGLCQFQGVYHIFYQFCPWDAQGNTSKAWAHLTSDNFIHWKQQKIAIMPDTIADQDGAYSGSSCIYQNNMYLYYTGNVKKSGEHDYITTGREANTIVIESKDGNNFEHKELLLVNEDYPDDYTCHVRDPKVWLENNRFFMVQGGRKISDKGAVILFSSKDPYRFEVIKEITTSDVFGYMWECPDYITIDG